MISPLFLLQSLVWIINPVPPTAFYHQAFSPVVNHENPELDSLNSSASTDAHANAGQFHFWALPYARGVSELRLDLTIDRRHSKRMSDIGNNENHDRSQRTALLSQIWYFLMTCCSIIVIATARTGDHFWSLLLAGFLILPSPVSIFLVVHAHWHFTGLAMVYAHHAGKDSLLLPAVSFVAREVVLLAQRGAEEVGRSFLDLSFLRPLAVAVGITSPTATVEGSVPLIIQGAASISAEMAGRAILPLAAIAVGAWALLGVVKKKK